MGKMNKKLIKNAEMNGVKAFKDTESKEVYLRNDFFDDERIIILGSMPSGSTMIIIYMKLACKYMNEDGEVDVRGIPAHDLAKEIEEEENMVEYALDKLNYLALVKW